MAPRRGGGGGGSDGDTGSEQTMKLSLPEGFRSSYTAITIIDGILMGFFFFFFIWSIVNTNQWSKTPERRFVTMTVWISLFWLVGYGLDFGDCLAQLLEATVFQSWVLLPGWESTFSIVAELLLIAVIYYILHNRLRAVSIPKETVLKFAFIHWSFLVIMIILAMVLLAGVWALVATYLRDLKAPWYSDAHENQDFVESTFYRIHFRRTKAAFYVLRFLMQLEMFAIGGLVLIKSGNNPGGRTTNLLFLIGSLATYIIAPLTSVVVTFKYWNAEKIEPWLPQVQWGLISAARGVCVLFICIFAAMMDHQQWELGTTRELPAPQAEAAVYKEVDGETYHHPAPPQAQGYYAPSGQYR